METRSYQEPVYAYIIPNLEFPLVLGKPQLIKNKAFSVPHQEKIWHSRADHWIPHISQQSHSNRLEELEAATQVTGSTFMAHLQRIRKNHGKSMAELAVFAVSLEDINKALRAKIPPTEEELQARIPPEFHNMLPLFIKKEADKLNPHKPRVDHKINLKTDKKNQEVPVPFRPVYSISREELLVLKKTLRDLLDKGFIRASSSKAGSPVIFIRKPGRGLRFYYDYKALNQITKTDQYPLPLISETLRNLTKAHQFTKVDIIQAFHKIRIKEGHKQKTAFQTRYRLFKQLITPFGLYNAPTTFQRYINSILHNLLDEYYSAYIDNILIYTSGTRNQHIKTIQEVFQQLAENGLHLDPDKYKFAQKKVKYLGFIIVAGIGVMPDPKKIHTISEQEAPTSVKGVRSFLGFANFYRIFIKDYSTKATPLTALTRKGMPFQQTKEHQGAFNRLKEAFIQAPVLTQWDPDKKTFLEANCSGQGLGGVLSHEINGQLKPIAFHSRKLTAAKHNYQIANKEILAIMDYLHQQHTKLKSIDRFTILSDHKNLEHFITKQQLSERQARYTELLADFPFNLVYRPGKEASVPNALSQRDQDQMTPTDKEARTVQMIPEDTLSHWHFNTTQLEGGIELENLQVFNNPDLQRLQPEAISKDQKYAAVYRAILQGDRKLDSNLKLRIQLAEYHINPQGHLRHRNKLWIPGAPIITEDKYKKASPEDLEANILHMKIIQGIHDSSINGHPGREGMISAISQHFYQPLL